VNKSRKEGDRANPIDRLAVSNKWPIIGLVSLFAFLAITTLVVSKITQGYEAQLALVINTTNLGLTLNNLLIVSSEYGREYFWIPVVGLMLLIGKKDTKLLAVELAALFVVGIVVGEALKFLMYRARPFEVLSSIVARVPASNDSSYPSGHALIVSIGAIFAYAKFRRRSIVVLLAIEAGIVCYARVYVGMHYPLDVISGIFLGGFIVFVGMFVLERFPPFAKIISKIAAIATKILRIGLFSL
jgi:undecaprenyl-diphosphatase